MLLWKLFVCVQPSLATYLSLFENDARKFCPRGNKSWEFWHDWNSAIFENCPRLLLDCSVYNNVHNVIHHFQGLFFLSKFLIMIVVSSWNIFQERSCYDLIGFWRWCLSLIEFLIQSKDAWKIEVADKCWYQRFQPLLNGLKPNPNKDNFYHGDSIYVTKPSWIRINEECFVL